MEILNNFLADVGENLAKKFGESDRCGNSFINRVTPVCDEIKSFSFFSLKLFKVGFLYKIAQIAAN